MYIWILFLAFLFIVKACMGNLNTPEKRKKYLFIVGIITILLLSLRGENYGGVYDVRAYKDYLERMAKASWRKAFTDPEFEVGFVLLNKILAHIAPFGQAILIFHAVLCITAVCVFIYKNTKEVFWAYFFFVTLGTMGFMMTGIRQSIAIAICLLSVESIKEKKLLKYIVLVLLAASIHRTAIIFIVAYFLCNTRFLQKNAWMSILIVVAIALLAPQIIDMAENVYDDFSAGDEASFSLNGIVPILIYALAIGLSLVYKRKQVSNSNTLVLTAAGLGFYVFRFYSMILERVSFFYTPASNLLLADVVGEIRKDRYGNLFLFIIILLAFVLFFDRLQTNAWGNYIFFWEGA